MSSASSSSSSAFAAAAAGQFVDEEHKAKYAKWVDGTQPVTAVVEAIKCHAEAAHPGRWNLGQKLLQVILGLVTKTREIFLSEEEGGAAFLYVAMDRVTCQLVGLVVKNKEQVSDDVVAATPATSATPTESKLDLELVWKRPATKQYLVDLLIAFMCDFPTAVFHTTGGRCIQFQNKQTKNSSVAASLAGMEWMAKSNWQQVGVWIPSEDLAARSDSMLGIGVAGAQAAANDASDPDQVQILLLDLLRSQFAT